MSWAGHITAAAIVVTTYAAGGASTALVRYIWILQNTGAGGAWLGSIKVDSRGLYQPHRNRAIGVNEWNWYWNWHWHWHWNWSCNGVMTAAERVGFRWGPLMELWVSIGQRCLAKTHIRTETRGWQRAREKGKRKMQWRIVK